MSHISRRNFLKQSALGAGFVAGANMLYSVPQLFARPAQDLVLRPYPHPWMPEMTWAYASDINDDPFRSQIQITGEGIVVPAELSGRRISITTRWFVDDFGYLMLTADNGGEKYDLADLSEGNKLSLNYEFARTRILRNRRIFKQYQKSGTKFSAEVIHLNDLAEELYEKAGKTSNNPEKSAGTSDAALKYALWCGEKMELEKAAQDIARRNNAEQFFFGCETRQYIWAKSEEFTKRFPELFNFATLTHYVWDTWYELFEPREGVYNWGVKDNIVNWLMEENITIQGRPLFWFHPAVTPDWLKEKNIDQLKKYMARHTKDLVTHYGDKIRQWSVMNEYHDWANIHDHTPEQITELTRFACDQTKEVDPGVTRIINNCCPFADYAPWGKRAGQKEPGDRHLRSPRKYIADLHAAGVDYDVLGIQLYFPRRDLSDIVRLIETFEQFGKPIYITEIGVTSFGINRSKITDPLKLSDEPYEWHRYWDEDLQADWLEQVYSVLYARPSIKAINWYDFSDFRPFIVNGGLVREDVSTKQSFHRLKEMLATWGRSPRKKI